jgi:hypothetical protein
MRAAISLARAQRTFAMRSCSTSRAKNARKNSVNRDTSRRPRLRGTGSDLG